MRLGELVDRCRFALTSEIGRGKVILTKKMRMRKGQEYVMAFGKSGGPKGRVIEYDGEEVVAIFDALLLLTWIKEHMKEGQDEINILS